MKFLSILFLLIPLLSFSQGPIANEISQLIQSGDITKAEKKVEEYLKKNPKEVDAIMMKGNVLLNKECCDQPIVLKANTDELIYSNSIGSIGDGGPMIVSKELGTRVADLWKLAVSYDLTRTDIHFGICQIYSISMMTDELIEYLPVLKKYVEGEDKLHYSMCDYARNLKDRGDFESALRVYKYVTSLYPDETGLYSDIAAEYFFHGDIDLSKEYIDIALKNENLDQLSLGNAFFFYSVMGEYDEALNCLKRQSKITGVNEHLFYQSLLNFSRGSDWTTLIEEYLDLAQNPSWKEAASFMASSEFEDNLDSYQKLSKMKLHDGFKILIHQAFKARITDEIAPFFNYAELLTYNQLYGDAIKEFQKIENSPHLKDQKDVENVAYYYAWSLWESGQKELSLEKWKKLESSENFQYQSASAYFQGKYYYDLDNKEKAKEYFEIVQERANESKFATLAWNMYNSIN